MGRPKINPDDKRNKAVSVYLTQELKDAFTEKINSDTNFIAKGNLNAVVNKLIYDYVYGITPVSSGPNNNILTGLSESETAVLSAVLLDKNKRDYLFTLINDSIKLSK